MDHVTEPDYGTRGYDPETRIQGGTVGHPRVTPGEPRYVEKSEPEVKHEDQTVFEDERRIRVAAHEVHRLLVYRSEKEENGHRRHGNEQPPTAPPHEPVGTGPGVVHIREESLDRPAG